MRQLLLIAMIFSISIPSGMLDELLPTLPASDDMPSPAATEDCAESVELLKVTDGLYWYSGSIVLVSEPVMTGHPLTSPCVVVGPEDRESHYCRPPPVVS